MCLATVTTVNLLWLHVRPQHKLIWELLSQGLFFYSSPLELLWDIMCKRRYF